MTNTTEGTADTATFQITSASHEFVPLSWFANRIIISSAFELVGEASQHRPIWGLMSDGKERKAVLPFPAADIAGVWIGSRQVDSVVGTMEDAAKMTALWFHFRGRKHLRNDDAVDIMTRIWQVAKKAFHEAFREEGVPVYYTRKIYEMVQWQAFPALPKRSIRSVVLPRDMQDDILRDVREFYSQERLYASFGRPYKRVYLLHGPPGTGKSSIVAAVASETERPLAIFNTDSLRDDTFVELLSDLPEGAIMILEDVDSMFRPDRKAAGDGGMTFSAMLNALDGVLSPRGAVVFMTTNHLDRLDEAVRRPGRVDRMLYVPYADADQVSKMWRRAFDGTVDKKKTAKKSSHYPTRLLAHAEKSGVSPARLAEVLFRYRRDGIKEEDASIRIIDDLSLSTSSVKK